MRFCSGPARGWRSHASWAADFGAWDVKARRLHCHRLSSCAFLIRTHPVPFDNGHHGGVPLVALIRIAQSNAGSLVTSVGRFAKSAPPFDTEDTARCQPTRSVNSRRRSQRANERRCTGSARAMARPESPRATSFAAASLIAVQRHTYGPRGVEHRWRASRRVMMGSRWACTRTCTNDSTQPSDSEHPANALQSEQDAAGTNRRLPAWGSHNLVQVVSRLRIWEADTLPLS
jgi:hypothetical protein